MGYQKFKLNPKVAPTVRAEHHNTANVHFVASTQTNGISMQHKSTKNTMENVTPETSQQSLFPKSQTTIYSVLDSLVRALALRGKDEDLKTPEGQCFLKSLGFYQKKDPDLYFLKTSRVCLATTREKLSRQSLGFSLTWGIELNGRYLIASTMEFPKTGSGCSLSDILEEKVDKKYFLSEKAVEVIMDKSTRLSMPITIKDTANKEK